jgi:hypothetical protein
MSRVAPAFVLFALAVLFVSIPGDARGCGGVYHPGERVDVADETALIVYDEATKTQHFIRQATFVGSAYDFGFLVPTPTRPQLESADPDLFTELAKITEPKTETRFEIGVNIGCGGGSPVITEKLNAELPRGVVVLEQKRVGDLDAAVLAFRHNPGQQPEGAAEELLTWLNNHQYAVRPDLADWLVPYVRDRWVITAFKIAGQPTEKTRPTEGIALNASAVRMSFKTDRPFFPYREPADQRDERAKNVPRLLRVYVAAKQRMSGKFGTGSTAWVGKTVWANAVTELEHTSLLGKAKLPAETAAGGWWLTEFEDRSSPRRGTEEVYFEPAADKSIVARAPRIVAGIHWWSFFATLAVVGVLIVGAIIYNRWQRKSATA